MDHKRLAELFTRYYAGQLGGTEETEFFSLLKETPDEVLETLMKTEWTGLDMQQRHFDPEVSRKLIDNILLNRPSVPAGTRSTARFGAMARRWLVAASVALLVFAGISIYHTKYFSSPSPTGEGISEHALFAGGNPIVLTDDQGLEVVLDSAYHAISVAADGVRYDRGTADGTTPTRYATRITDGDRAISWHTLTVPRGSQFHITLPDGTRVWLNAASSIRFPSKFTDEQRIIELQGEAYLEVEKDRRAPFSVVYAGGKVEVLGTRFNLRAYPGQPVQTALLAGAVRMGDAKTSAILSPGQLAETSHDRIVVRHHETIEHAVAWKTGFFVFEDTDVQNILRDIERWYDITVVYNGLPPSKRLTGTIGQHVPLAEVLNMIRFAGIACTFENRQLTLL